MRIGPSIFAELAAVGLQDIPLAFTPDGVFDPYDGLTDDQKAAHDPPLVSPIDALDFAVHLKLNRVLAAHDPDRPAPPAVPASVSKLGLVRALRERGDWIAVKTAIAGNTTIQDDWDAAVTISRSDPLTQTVIAFMRYTPPVVDAIMIRAQALVSADA